MGIVGMTEICQELRSHLLAQGLLNPVISFPIMEGVQCRCQYSTVQYSTVSVSILNRQLHNYDACNLVLLQTESIDKNPPGKSNRRQSLFSQS